MTQPVNELGDIISSWIANDIVKSQTAVSIKNVYKKEVNDFVFMAGDSEMIRVSKDGFSIRGQRVEQDAEEAESVYRSFREWLVWAQLNRI